MPCPGLPVSRLDIVEERLSIFCFLRSSTFSFRLSEIYKLSFEYFAKIHRERINLMMQNVDNWEKFINENLLQFGVVDGVLLITKRGEAVYSQGKLSTIERKYTEQFVKIFNASTSEQETTLCSKGFDLKDDHFTIYHKTFCSIYCTSEHNKQGVIVCNLPYSVMIASYPCGQTNTEVIRIVENACKILRM